MKGLIFDIRRFSVHDGPGIRTTVFLKGCPLTCVWCHNPEGREFSTENTRRTTVLDGKTYTTEEIIGKWMNTVDVLSEVLNDRVFMEESNGGVTFSGGEPLMQHRFVAELAKLCREKGLHTALDTTGYSTHDALIKVIPWINLFLYDLKIIDGASHEKYTGVSNNTILRNLTTIVEAGKEVIIRIPVIPGISDGIKNAYGVVDILNKYNGKIKEINLLPYHSIASHKYKKQGLCNPMESVPALNSSKTEEIRKILEAAGYYVKIGG